MLLYTVREATSHTGSAGRLRLIGSRRRDAFSSVYINNQHSFIIIIIVVIIIIIINSAKPARAVASLHHHDNDRGTTRVFAKWSRNLFLWRSRPTAGVGDPCRRFYITSNLVSGDVMWAEGCTRRQQQHQQTAIVITRLPSDPRPTTRECVYLVRWSLSVTRRAGLTIRGPHTNVRRGPLRKASIFLSVAVHFFSPKS